MRRRSHSVKAPAARRRWELQAVNPLRAERRRKGCVRGYSTWMAGSCFQEHAPVAAGSSAPDVPHALSRVSDEGTNGRLCGRSEHGAMTHVWRRAV